MNEFDKKTEKTKAAKKKFLHITKKVKEIIIRDVWNNLQTVFSFFFLNLKAVPHTTNKPFPEVQFHFRLSTQSDFFHDRLTSPPHILSINNRPISDVQKQKNPKKGWSKILKKDSYRHLRKIIKMANGSVLAIIEVCAKSDRE